MTLKSLEKISFIHVAGSKGKGSVCTYTDAMLREFNVKTGLFTSPHLISVTERIKLMGTPISKSEFTKYFFEVYDALQKKKSHEADLPPYFKFLLVMAFYIFVREQVKVAVIEVGIGGAFDCTNVLKNTEIVGITALQLEHTQLLGNTLEDIAWQKSGIIKENSNVFTMPQPAECMKVINDRFKELKGKRLSLIPSINDYKWINCSKPDFSTSSEVNALNFSMATQMTACWLKNRDQNFFAGDSLLVVDERFTNAFNKTQFDGRFQIIKDKGINFFLDGAHTKDSIYICADWFSKQLNLIADKHDDENFINILIFNVTGDRDSELIMKQLHSIKFDYVCFTTNIINNDVYNEQSGELK
jgi:folylpolyglutamate synthase